MPQTGARVDPLPNFNFLVELEGIAQASFIECSGLGSTTEVIEVREGGDNTTVRKQAGRNTFPELTLKWGLTSSRELWDWRQQIVDGTMVRKNGSIVVYDLSNHVEMARWNFVQAWPTRWEGSAFNAKGSDIAIDTLVLVHEGLTRV